MIKNSIATCLPKFKKTFVRLKGYEQTNVFFYFPTFIDHKETVLHKKTALPIESV